MDRTYYYVNSKAEKNVINYDYHSVDESVIAPRLAPLWKNLSGVFPLWVNPNVITVIGLLHMFVGYGLIYYYCGFSSECNAPNWVYFVIAYLLFAYETFDALDGQQGKRVGMYTNATTELFDHGCDSITTIISALIFCHVFNLLQYPNFAFLLLISVFTIFYMHTWEHTCTGTMTFRFSGNPTEGLFSSIFTLIITGIFGPQLWLKEIGSFIPIGSYVGSIRLNHIAVLFMMASTLLTAKSNIISVFKHATKYKTDVNEREATTGSVNTRLLELLPYLLMVTVGLLLVNHRIYNLFPRQVLFAIGLQWNQMVMRLIIAEITKQPYNWQASLTTQLSLVIPLIFQFDNLSSTYYGAFVALFVVYSLVQNIQMAYYFSSEMCTILGMKHWWSIPEKKAAKTSE